MRTITTTSCLAILILSAVVTARLGDPVATPSTPAPASANPTAADVNAFLSGVWDSIGLGHDFDDFSACVQEDNNAGAQLQKAITLMNSSSASNVSHGLNKLDQVVSPLIAGLKSCNMTDKYTSTIKQIIDTFTNPDKLAVQTGASIMINGVEVYPDIAAAIAACNENSFAECGSSIGSAMGNVFYGNDSVTSADQAAQINSIPNITWTAVNHPEFKGINMWQFKKARITLRRQKSDSISSNDNSADDSRRNLATIPAAFDARTTWSSCIHPIRDQGNCGDCWAFSTSEVLSDRFCIVSNQSTNIVMSPQYLVSCDTTSSACNGGYISRSWKFMEKTGELTDSCAPYKSGRGSVPSCSTLSKCSDNSAYRHYYAKTNSTKSFTTPTAIQTEVLTNGPVSAGMDVYSDFMSYSSGIYSNTARSSYLGGHAVKIIGWGSSNSINYWIVANSWGTSWGEAGYFRIKFGSCSIDTSCYAGLPDLTRS